MALNRDERVKLVNDVLGFSTRIEVYQAIGKKFATILGVVGTTKQEERLKEEFLVIYPSIKTVEQCREQFWKEGRFSDQSTDLINLMEKILLQGDYYKPHGQPIPQALPLSAIGA